MSFLMVSACTVQPEDRFALTLASACPAADLRSTVARDACANTIGDAPEIASLMRDVILWGGQSPGTPLERALESTRVTEFEPRVWRRLYLSTFTFAKAYRIEEHPPYRVVIVPVQFRNALPDGEYPYPFWHSAEKWAAYQEATQISFFFREGALVGALRGGERDSARANVARQWDGKWRWDEGRQPRVSLYSYAFSPENDAVDALDAAYRALESRVRERGCDSCHAPDNPQKMRSLEILNYPAHALAARRSLVSILEHNEMPPMVGISEEAARLELRDLAQAFVVAADAALLVQAELDGTR